MKQYVRLQQHSLQWQITTFQKLRENIMSTVYDECGDILRLHHKALRSTGRPTFENLEIYKILQAKACRVVRNLGPSTLTQYQEPHGVKKVALYLWSSSFSLIET